MAVVLSIKDVEQEMKKTPNAIIVNNLPVNTDVDRKFIERISSTRYDRREKLSTVPTCGCGTTKNGVNLGSICEYCGTEVTMNASRLQSELWIKAPNGIRGLILPQFLLMLTKVMQVRRGYNGMHYLLNPKYKSPRSMDANSKRFIKLFGDVPRGIDNFIENIDLILDRIIAFRGNNAIKPQKIKQFYEKHKDKVFPKYLPIPSRLTMLVEESNIYTYYNKSIDSIMDAIYTVAGVSEETDKVKTESKMATSLLSLVSYHEHIQSTNIGGKTGITRKSLLGSRLSNSLRTIVTSQAGPHRYNYVKIPKKLACIVMMPAIIGEFVRKGMTLLQAYDYVKSNSHNPTDKILDVMNDLVQQTRELNKKTLGIDKPFLMFNVTRYPGLRLGSSTTFFVDEFSDDSIELSVLCLRAMNADFDGDELSAVWIHEAEHMKAFMNLQPHMDIHSNRSIGTLSNSMDFPDTAHFNLMNKLESEEYVI